jgi:hypothetical protein
MGSERGMAAVANALLDEMTAALDAADRLATRAGIDENVPRWGGDEFRAAWLKAENAAIDAACKYAGVERTAAKVPPLPEES